MQRAKKLELLSFYSHKALTKVQLWPEYTLYQAEGCLNLEIATIYLYFIAMLNKCMQFMFA